MSSKDPSTRQPEYVIIDKLPGSEIPFLLGRIVANPRSPIDEYKPEDPRSALDGKYLELFDKDFSTLFSGTTNGKAEAIVGRVLGFDVTKETSTSVKQTGKIVRTRVLPQHREALQALLKTYRADILKFLGDNKKTGYMVVGVKSALDGQQNRKNHQGSKKRLRLNVPTGAAVNALSHGTIDVGDSADIGLDANTENAWTVSSKSTLVGEQVFAIRYRRITLRTIFLSAKEGEVKLGDVAWTRNDEGVFGDRERELTEDDDDDDDEEVEEEDDVEVNLEEGVDLHTDESTMKEVNAQELPCFADDE